MNKQIRILPEDMSYTYWIAPNLLYQQHLRKCTQATLVICFSKHCPLNGVQLNFTILHSHALKQNQWWYETNSVFCGVSVHQQHISLEDNKVLYFFFKKLDTHHLVKKIVHVATKCTQLNQKHFFLRIFKTKHLPHASYFFFSWFPLFQCCFIWLQIKWNSHVIKREKGIIFLMDRILI